MKKLLSLTLAILMILSVVPLSVLSVGAETVTSGVTGDCTWKIDGTKLTISGNGEMGDYYYDKPAQPWPLNITEVVIEEGVTSVGSRAFNGCKYITDFTIPKSVKYIYGQYNCNIENLHIPSIDFWFKISYIYNFFDSVKYLCCDGEIISDLVIPEDVTEIPANAFSGYKELKSVTFTTLPITVNSGAFKNCDNIKNIYVSDLSKWIKSNFLGADFGYNWDVSEMQINNCYSNPLRYAENFYVDGKLLEGELKIPSGITEIGEGVFCGYNRIKKVTISDDVKRVGKAAFEGCKNLEEVKFGKNVFAISHMAFYECSSLKKIKINKKIDAIGYLAFANCTSLTDVWFDGVKDEFDEVRFKKPSRGNFEESIKYFKNANWHYNQNKTLAKITVGWNKEEWLLYENGVRSKQTTLVKYEGKWFYVNKGKWSNTTTTTFKYNGKIFYIKNGKWKKDYKGLGYYNDQYFYFKNGKWDKTKTGFVSYRGKKYLVKDGKVVHKNTLVKYKGTYYYLSNGAKTDITTIKKIDGKWYYIKNGKWSKEKAIVRYVPKKVKIKKGVYIRSYYLEGYKGELFYVNKGYAQLDYTGKVRVDGKTYNIKNGIVV